MVSAHARERVIDFFFKVFFLCVCKTSGSPPVALIRPSWLTGRKEPIVCLSVGSVQGCRGETTDCERDFSSGGTDDQF